tara:strand:+ start:712 stop:1938 length:1227 start_codon:yes stop_codon:yes gene_type:complete
MIINKKTNILIIIVIIITVITIGLILYNIYYQNKCNNYIGKITSDTGFVYPIAWEDPSVDNKYLDVKNSDKILMITTGGCNVLHNLLLNPKQIMSCDLSPSQNAILDLKLSAIKNLDYNDFWKMFGLGKHENFEYLYNTKLKNSLKLYSSVDFWNKNIKIITKKGLYRSGKNCELGHIFFKILNKKMKKLFTYDNAEEQYIYYKKNIKPLIFNKITEKIVNNLVLEFVGVPKSQIKIVTGGDYDSKKLYKFVENCYDFVLRKWSLKNENYFFHGLLLGYFTKENCPEYLKEENYEFLKINVDKVNIFNGTLNDCMNNSNIKFDKFILLDHMDWYENKEQIDTIFNLMKNNSSKKSVGFFRSGNSKSWITEHIEKYNDINLIDLCHEYENDRLGTYPGFFKFEIVKNNN